MHSGSSGVGGASHKPEEIRKMEGPEEHDKGKPDVEKVLHTKVSSLGQLKSVMTKNLGEEEGNKLYNSFLTSFGMMMLHQVQRSAAHIKKAAQDAKRLGH